MERKICRKEKRILVTLISLILILGIYSLYVYHNYIAGNPSVINDFKFWGKAFLVLIPVMIVAQIIIHIVFFIINKIVTNQDIPTITDEMDKLIELKALRIYHWAVSIGFVLSIGSQAIGMQHWVLFILLIFSCFGAAIASEIAKIYFYQKGV
jgi:cell division protein FtsL